VNRNELQATIYDALRQQASAIMKGERADHTLQPTALVHEAYLKLAAESDWVGADRTRILALAAMQMRRILVDSARSRRRLKRGGDRDRQSLSDVEGGPAGRTLDVLALHEALEELAAVDPPRAKIVELRYFGGMTTGEIAESLDVSRKTVERGWDLARCWLEVRLDERD